VGKVFAASPGTGDVSWSGKSRVGDTGGKTIAVAISFDKPRRIQPNGKHWQGSISYGKIAAIHRGKTWMHFEVG
jgi:hypothetical protein